MSTKASFFRSRTMCVGGATARTAFADTHLVENVETWRMDRMSRQNLIGRTWVLVQE